MANIKVTIDYPIANGHPLTFKSPADCSQVTGLAVHYTEDGTNKSKAFQFADAHGNNVGSIDLFAANVLVKVILDVDASKAYVQNADTNAYLEGKFDSKAPAGYGLGSNTPVCSDLNDFTLKTGWYQIGDSTQNRPDMFGYGIMEVVLRSDGSITQTLIGTSSNTSLTNKYHSYNLVLRRARKSADEWGEWEWDTPRMHRNVEYRTTERYLNNAVYSKVNTDGSISKYYKSGDTNIAIPVPVNVEQGTWTPVPEGFTATDASGGYTRVGKLVTVVFDMTITELTSEYRFAEIQGLPFAANRACYVGTTYGPAAKAGTRTYLRYAENMLTLAIAPGTTSYVTDVLAGTGRFYGSITYAIS